MLERPTAEEIRAAAERFGWFSLDDSEVAAYTELSDLVLAVIDGVADDLELAPTVPDRPYRRPTGEEDPYNAIVHWCDVQATASGLLDGVRVAVLNLHASRTSVQVAWSTSFAESGTHTVRLVNLTGGSAGGLGYDGTVALA